MSEVVEKISYAGCTPIYLISYTCPADFHVTALRGLTLVDGIRYLAHEQAGNCVRFGRMGNEATFRKAGIKADQVLMRVGPTAPGLAELVAERQRRHDLAMAPVLAKREAERLADQELLALMRQREAELAALIPADHVRVMARQTGDLDGDPIMEYTVGDEKVSWRDLTVHGTASAVRPGAMGAFASEQVCSISRARLDEIRAERQRKAAQAEQKEQQRREQREAAFAQAQQTGQPVLLSSRMEPCCERDFDCSLDVVEEYALPGGKTEIRRAHTH